MAAMDNEIPLERLKINSKFNIVTINFQDLLWDHHYHSSHQGPWEPSYRYYYRYYRLLKEHLLIEDHS